MKTYRLRMAAGGLFLACFLLSTKSDANTLDYILLNEEGFDAGSEYSFSDDRPKSRRHADARWQFEIDPGYAFLNRYKYQGFEYSNGTSIEAAVLYQLSSSWQIGIKGGGSFGHKYKEPLINISGFDFYLEHVLNLMHIAPSLKFGRWQEGPKGKRWRPYVQGGAGWYQVKHKTDYKVDYSIYQFRYELDDMSHHYLGGEVGGGLECELYAQGLVGIHVAYHRVFASGDDVSFIIPSLQLSYLF